MTQPTSGFGALSTGFVPETVQDIINDETADVLATIANDLDCSPVAPLGQVIGITAEKMAELWELAQVAYNATNRGAAEGALLDNIGALTGTPRLPATYSSAWCTCAFSTPGTYAPGSLQGFIVGLSAQYATNASAVVVPATNPLNGNPVSATNPYVTGSAYATATLFIAPVVGPNFGAALSAAETALDTNPQLGAFTGQVPVTGWLGPTALSVTASVMQWSPTVTFASAVTLSQGTALTFDTSGAVYFLAANVVGATTATLTYVYVGSTNTTATANLLGLSEVSAPYVGTLVETDTHYRLRQAEELGAQGSCTLSAIAVDVIDALQAAPITVIAACSVYENTNDWFDANGLPPHSYQVVVFDGLNPNTVQNNPIIGQAIWQNKPAGIRPYGSIAVTVVDSQGVQRTVTFSRPTEMVVWMTINVQIASTANAKNVEQLIQLAIWNAAQGNVFVAYGYQVAPNPGATTTLNPGTDVIPGGFQGIAQAQAGVVQVTSVWVAFTSSPTSSQVLEVPRSAIAVLPLSNIVVNCSVFVP